MDNNKKRYIPGSRPDRNLELPDGDLNSLVTKSGKNWDNGYNFDEKDGSTEELTYDDLAKKVKFDPAAAEKAKQEAKEAS